MEWFVAMAVILVLIYPPLWWREQDNRARGAGDPDLFVLDQNMRILRGENPFGD